MRFKLLDVSAFLILAWTSLAAETLKVAPEQVNIIDDKYFDEARSDKMVFINFCDPREFYARHFAPKWNSLSERYKDSNRVSVIVVDVTKSVEVGRYGLTEKERNDASREPLLKFYPVGSEKAMEYWGGMEAEDLVEFVEKQIGEESELLVPEYVGYKGFLNEAKTYVILFGSKNLESFNEAYTAFSEAAAHLEGKMQCVFVDSNKYSNRELIENWLGINSHYHLPNVFILSWDNEEKELKKFYANFSNWDKDEIISLSERFYSDNLESYYKSENIPENWNSTPVKVLVGKTFHDVISSGKHVFVLIYAPWDGHAKHLQPTWDKLGEQYADSDSIIIAKIDFTKNDRVFKFSSPLLIFYPAGTGQRIEYTGSRNLEHLIEFVETQITTTERTAGNSEL